MIEHLEHRLEELEKLVQHYERGNIDLAKKSLAMSLNLNTQTALLQEQLRRLREGQSNLIKITELQQQQILGLTKLVCSKEPTKV
jgi:hypothetical protein